MTPNPHSIMRRKPLADIEDDIEKTGLFKSLGLWQLTAIGVGGIVGIGVFSLAGLVAEWKPEILPHAEFVARLAAPRMERGEHVDPADAAPLYVRDKVAKTVAERLAEGGRA